MWKNLCGYFWVLLKSVFETFYLTIKAFVKKSKKKKNKKIKGSLFLIGWPYKYHLWFVFGHLGALSKTCILLFCQDKANINQFKRQN